MRFLPEKKKHLVIALALASLALSGMYGLLNLSGVWWRDNRSVNALDELYYATLDSCSEEALSYDLITHDSYLSVVLPGESEPVEAMDGVRNLYSTLSQKPLKHTRSGINDILEATYWGGQLGTVAIVRSSGVLTRSLPLSGTLTSLLSGDGIT